MLCVSVTEEGRVWGHSRGVEQIVAEPLSRHVQLLLPGPVQLRALWPAGSPPSPLFAPAFLHTRKGSRINVSIVFPFGVGNSIIVERTFFYGLNLTSTVEFLLTFL